MASSVTDSHRTDVGDRPDDSASYPYRRPPTAQAAVLSEVRRAILYGEMRPGSQILQENLAERLSVSRVPVREALKILQGEGQVSYSPHRGYFVTELTYAELEEVYWIREALERLAVLGALDNINGDDIARMEQAIADMRRADAAQDIGALTSANRQFHFTLMEPVSRPRLLRVIRQLWDSTDPYRSVYFGSKEHRQLVDEEHRAILEATVARDVERVLDLMALHREHAIESLRPMLEPEASDS